MAIDNPKYKNAKTGYLKWKEYVNAFGLGKKLGIDLPSENKANIPDTAQYNKDFGNPRYWNSCYMLTLGIGQDRMTATPLQLANTMAFIANEGYNYTPHFVDSIEKEEEQDKAILEKYSTKQKVTNIQNNIFKVIKEGMHDVTVNGTAPFIKVPDMNIAPKQEQPKTHTGKITPYLYVLHPKTIQKLP
jgi:penicillin-binding protein 2